MSKRIGMTLIELLVVIAILGVLIALLIPAIQRVREAAARIHSMNNMRQIVLGAHSFASANRGRLPSMDGNRSSANNRGYPTFVAILPFLERDSFDFIAKLREQPLTTFALYVSPADPTFDGGGVLQHYPLTSYCVNAQAFHHDPSLDRTFRDGTSNTIAFAERYMVCRDTLLAYNERAHKEGFSRRATFADGGRHITPDGLSCGDFYPEFGRPVPSDTFQARPAIEKCNPRLAQTPHASGMLVAAADGTVRTFSTSISAHAFWAAVTPGGSELVTEEW